jgi:hypothetical protein
VKERTGFQPFAGVSEVMKLRHVAIRIAAFGLAAALPGAANAQLFYTDPVFDAGPMELTDPWLTAAFPGATQAETRAALVWNLRSALNVAALQCQFSRYLRAVDNYNAIIDHHSGELARAYTALGGYFTRVHGRAAGQRQFDQWSTATYNDFTSPQGQVGYCQVAADIARDVLARPKGQFYEAARARLRELRAALGSARDRIYAPAVLPLRPLPPTLFAAPDCTGLRGRDLQACQAR